MSSGEKQLLADVFHGVLLKFFVTCMSVPIFPAPVGAAEHWGPAAEVVGGAGCAGRGLWGPIPAAVSTVPAASGPGVTAGNTGLPSAAWQPPPSAAEPLCPVQA